MPEREVIHDQILQANHNTGISLVNVTRFGIMFSTKILPLLSQLEKKGEKCDITCLIKIKIILITSSNTFEPVSLAKAIPLYNCRWPPFWYSCTLHHSKNAKPYLIK